MHDILYKKLFELSHDGIALLDLETNFIEANPAYSQITGYSTEALKQTSCIAMSLPEDIPKAQASLKELHQNGHVPQLIKRCYHKNGHLITVDIAMVLLPDQKTILINTKDITERQTLTQQLAWQNDHDPLTHLLNRHALKTAFNQLPPPDDTHQHLLCFIDIDHFGRINQQYDENMGDQLLTQVAKRLLHITKEQDLIARHGGDEFLILLTNTPQSTSLNILKRIYQVFQSPFNLPNHQQVTLTLSTGIACQSMKEDFDTLLRRSEKALLQSKNMGRNQFIFFDAKIETEQQLRQQIQQEVLKAIHENQFELYYQPKINMKTGEVIGFEALIRWHHPEKGFMPPLTFLPHIEGTSIMIDLGNWVIHQALQQLTEWNQTGHNWHVSINIAANHLENPSFLPTLKQTLAQYPQVNHNQLEIEILETTSIENIDKLQKLIHQLHQLDIHVSLDDFGTGYSSLSYLKNLPIDVLKIDQSFVRDMLIDSTDLDLIKAITLIGQTFNCQVLAEGVETLEHGAHLIHQNCQFAQGYGIAKPMPAKDIPHWITYFKNRSTWQFAAQHQWKLEDLPIIMAQADHANWVAKILRYIEDPSAQTQLVEEEIVHDTHCRFGKWYYHQGKQQYGHLATFQNLEPLHKQVHQIGNQILQTLKSSAPLSHTQIQPLKTKLLKVKDQILTELENLQLEVLNPPPQTNGFSNQSYEI